MIDTQTLLSMDQRWALLGIDAARARTLKDEVDQLADAIETVRMRLRFDAEPAGFRRAAEMGGQEAGQ